MDADFQSHDALWMRFATDLKVNTMRVNRPLPSLHFDIPIRPLLRFDPSRRPPCVDLQLKRDTDAFIVDKIVLPLEPFTEPGDPRQRRVYYIIAWPDLRAARPIVDAIKILDYVSPRELEDWEYRDALRRVKKDKEAGSEAAAVKKGRVTEVGVPDGKKKPGRKPKNAMRAQVRPPTPKLDSDEEKMLARKKQGPSLSTPRNSRISRLESDLDLLDSEDVSADDPDVDIQRQLEAEATSRNSGGRYGQYDRPMIFLGSKNPASSSGDSSPPGRARSRSLKSSSLHKASSAVKASPTPPLSQRRPTPKHAQAILVSSNYKPTSSTPVPLPRQPSFPPKTKAPSSVTEAKDIPNSGLASRDQAYLSSHSSRPLATEHAPRSNTHSSHSPTPESRGGFVPANRYIPPGGHFQRPPKRLVEDSTEGGGSPEATSVSARPKQKRKKKQPKLSQPLTGRECPDEVVIKAEPEQEWVVKRLEGDQILDGVHYFKVRWEGDWPPEQNPTWEPQDNISSALVKRYLKRRAEREAAKPQYKKPKTKPSEGGKQQTLVQWAKKYASVSEAFEGKAELEHPPSLGKDLYEGDITAEADRHLIDDDDPDAIDELLVVDNSQARNREETAAEKARRLSAHVAAQFASLTPGRRTQL